jgi:hypothetical protein
MKLNYREVGGYDGLVGNADREKINPPKINE